MRHVPLTIILLFAAGPALAQETKPFRGPAPEHRTRESSNTAAEILRAAEHLEAAGLSGLAERLRNDAEAMQRGTAEKVLEQRLSELEALQAEVSALRQATGRQQQVRLNVQVIEIDSDKLHRAGLDLEAILNDVGGTTNVASPTATEYCYAGVVDSDHRILEAIEALRSTGAVQMLAEPELMTISGRPAAFNSRGEFPILESTKHRAITVAYRKYGTMVEVVPRQVGGLALELDVRVRIAELDDSRSVTVGNMTVPGLHVREVDTGAQLTVGQTLVVGGLKQSLVQQNRPVRGRQRVTAREILVLIRPELLDEPPPTMPRAAAKRAGKAME